MKIPYNLIHKSAKRHNLVTRWKQLDLKMTRIILEQINNQLFNYLYSKKGIQGTWRRGIGSGGHEGRFEKH